MQVWQTLWLEMMVILLGVRNSKQIEQVGLLSMGLVVPLNGMLALVDILRELVTTAAGKAWRRRLSAGDVSDRSGSEVDLFILQRGFMLGVRGGLPTTLVTTYAANVAAAGCRGGDRKEP